MDKNKNTEDLILKSLATKKTKEFILAHPEYRLTIWQRLRLFYFQSLRKKGWPMAYIAGHKEFFGLDFLVNHHILIPRPDTEVLVENAIEEIKRNKKTVLIDIGTGSGCIPIVIGKTLVDMDIEIVATDISKNALKIAHKNAKKHGIKIKFIHSNLLENDELLQYINIKFPYQLIITANLPYGWSAWKNNSSTETKSLKFEPQIALFAGKNGLELYEKLLKQLKNTKHPLTALFEFDPRQTTLLTNLIQTVLPKAKIEIKNDLAGRDRLVIIRLNS